MHYPLLVQPEL